MPQNNDNQKLQNRTTAGTFLSYLGIAVGNFDTEWAPSWDRLVCIHTDPESGQQKVSSLAELDKVPTSPQLQSEEDIDRVLFVMQQAIEGNLYAYDLDATMPRQVITDRDSSVHRSKLADVVADGVLQQPEAPSLWMRFANTVTFGWAYSQAFADYAQAQVTAQTNYAQAHGRYGLFDAYRATREAKVGAERSEYTAYAKQKKDSEYKADQLRKNQEFSETVDRVEQRSKNVLDLTKQEPTVFRDCQYQPKTTYALPEGLPFTAEQMNTITLAACCNGKLVLESGAYAATTEAGATMFTGHMFQDILNVGRSSSHVYFPLLDAGREKSFQALSQYAQGNKQPLADLLKEAFDTSIRAIRTTMEFEDAETFEGRHFLQVCQLLETHPELAEAAGISQDQLHTQEIEGYRNVAHTIEQGKLAKGQLTQKLLSGDPISPQEKGQLLGQILAGNYVLQRNAEGCKFDATRERLQKEMPEVVGMGTMDGDVLLYQQTPANQFQQQMGYPINIQAIREGVQGTRLYQNLMAQQDPIELLRMLNRWNEPKTAEEFRMDMATERTTAATKLIQKRQEEQAKKEQQENPEKAQQGKVQGKKKPDEMVTSGPKEAMIPGK